jgi:hypothetical protein
MQKLPPQSLKFLSAARRRMIIIQVAEAVAVCCAGASVLALILVGVLWLRGLPRLEVAVCAVGIGVACGLVWGIAQRPTILSTALEADRQFELHDLLGSLLTMPRSSEDVEESEWHDALAAMAESRCRSLRASDLVMHRIGMRGWGGMGILTALTLVLAGISGRPVNVTAEEMVAASDSNLTAVHVGEAKNSQPVEQTISRPPGAGGDEASRRRFETEQATAEDADEAGRSSRDAAGGKPGTGTGSAVTQSKPFTPPGTSAVEFPQDGKGTQAKATGSGVVSNSDDRGGIAGNGLATEAGKLSPTLPWKSQGWALDAAKAGRAVKSEEAPSEDRELIEDYFATNSENR